MGSSVDNLREGDRVWFVVPYCVQGSLSNYLVLDKEFVRKMPDEAFPRLSRPRVIGDA